MRASRKNWTPRSPRPFVLRLLASFKSILNGEVFWPPSGMALWLRKSGTARHRTSPHAQSSFRPTRPEPLRNHYALECALVKETSTDHRDPIYKISVTLSLDHDQQVEDLVVIRPARSGEKYTRSEFKQAPMRRPIELPKSLSFMSKRDRKKERRSTLPVGV